MDSSEERSGDNGHVDGAPEPIATSPYDGAFAEGPDIIPLSSAKHSVTLDGDSDADGNSSEVESGVENGADAELHINGTSEKYPFPMSGVPCETSAAVEEVLPKEESQTSTDPLQEGLWSEGNTESPSAVEHSFEQVGTPTDGDLVSDAYAIDVSIPVIPVEAVLAQTADNYPTREAILPAGNQDTEQIVVHAPQEQVLLSDVSIPKPIAEVMPVPVLIGAVEATLVPIFVDDAEATPAHVLVDSAEETLACGLVDTADETLADILVDVLEETLDLGEPTESVVTLDFGESTEAAVTLNLGEPTEAAVTLDLGEPTEAAVTLDLGEPTEAAVTLDLGEPDAAEEETPAPLLVAAEDDEEEEEEEEVEMPAPLLVKEEEEEMPAPLLVAAEEEKMPAPLLVAAEEEEEMPAPLLVAAEEEEEMPAPLLVAPEEEMTTPTPLLVALEKETTMPAPLLVAPEKETTTPTPLLVAPEKETMTPIPLLVAPEKMTMPAPLLVAPEKETTTPAPLLVDAAEATPALLLVDAAEATLAPPLVDAAEATPAPLLVDAAEATPAPLLVDAAEATPAPLLVDAAGVTPAPAVATTQTSTNSCGAAVKMISVASPIAQASASLNETSSRHQNKEASIVLSRVPGSLQGSPTKRVLSTEKQSPMYEHTPTKRPARVSTEDRSKKLRAEPVATRPKPLASPKSNVPLMRSSTTPKMKEVKPKIAEKATAKPALDRHASAPVRLTKPLAKTTTSRLTSRPTSKVPSATAAGVLETKDARSNPIKRPFGASRKENQDIHSKPPGARSKVRPSAEKAPVPLPAVSTQRSGVAHTSKPSTTCSPPRVALATGTRVRKYEPTLLKKVPSLPADSKAGTQAPIGASSARPKAKVSNNVRCPTGSMKTNTLQETGDGASADVKSIVKDKPVGKILPPRKVEVSTARSKPTSKDKPTRSAMPMPRVAPVRAPQGSLQTRTTRNASAKTTCNLNSSRVPLPGKKSEAGNVRSKSMPLHKTDVGTARPSVTKIQAEESTSSPPELPKQAEEPTCTQPPENIACTAESDVTSPSEKDEAQTTNANEVADEENPEAVIVQGENEHYSTDLASEDKSV